MSHSSSTALVLVALSVFAGCKEHKPDVASSTNTTAANGQEKPGAPMSAQQILEVTHYADVGEMAEARLAQDKATDPRVKTLAATMQEEHTDIDQKRFEISKKLQFQLTDSLTSASLEDDAHRTMLDLRGKSGADFDKGYVDAVVMQQQRLLDIIDARLLPAAADPDVQSYLGDVRKIVVEHLADATHLQGDLSSR